MTGIPSHVFSFLTELQANNNKPWFDANKKRYEELVKAPLLAFIGAFDQQLARLRGHFIADPRPTGGSLFRIYRDVRFSKDKTPYKTEAGIHFRHERGKDVHAPGYYLHLAPGHSFAACGLWHPETAQRAAIHRDQPGWLAAKQAAADQSLRLTGDSLKRPPKGYDADHPLIEDLKRKDFILSADVGDKELARDGFADRLAELWSGATPLMRLLTEAVGLEFYGVLASRRSRAYPFCNPASKANSASQVESSWVSRIRGISSNRGSFISSRNGSIPIVPLPRV